MNKHQADIDLILAKRDANGADYWAGDGGKIYVGNPFSTIASLLMLHELGMDAEHEAVAGGLQLILHACRPDGRIRVGPKSPLYPCYTAEAARVLCRFGLKQHQSMVQTVEYFQDAQADDGGWRCNFSRFGKGPETQCSNPGATLNVLDVLRHYGEFRQGNPVAGAAVESLLRHWVERKPIGPCHWGIGTQFMKVEFPFLRYNLFYYIYVLSHFATARADERFQQALAELKSRVDGSGVLQIQHRHRLLSKLEFCAKGSASTAATYRFDQILAQT